MTTPQFSRPGAIDLSALRPSTPAAAGGADQPAGSWAIDVVGEEQLRTEVVERSLSVVVLVSFWSEEEPTSVEINASLTRLSDEFGGRFVFARVDVDRQPELVEALRIPQIPLVVAALRGQLAPLIQQPLPDAELRVVLDQVLQAAAANGISGVSPPVSTGDTAAAGDEEGEAEPSSRHPEAEAALMSGNLEVAIEEYEKALTAAPGDADAALGLAQAKLLKRTQGVDPVAAREAAAADPSDVAAQTLAADLDLLGGHVDDAFARLIELVRRSKDDDRDAARMHLIELFGVVGDADPRVGRARSTLASALF
jgi:putative thioredoxin